MSQAAIGLIAFWLLPCTAFAQPNEVREIAWEQIPEQVGNRTVLLVQTAGGVLKGRIIAVEPEALVFKNNGSDGSSVSLASQDVREIRITDKSGKGSLKVLGVVIGAAAGFAAGACATLCDGRVFDSSTSKVIGASAGGTAGGAILGYFFGSRVGRKKTTLVLRIVD